MAATFSLLRELIGTNKNGIQIPLHFNEQIFLPFMISWKDMDKADALTIKNCQYFLLKITHHPKCQRMVIQTDAVCDYWQVRMSKAIIWEAGRVTSANSQAAHIVISVKVGDQLLHLAWIRR